MRLYLVRDFFKMDRKALVKISIFFSIDRYGKMALMSFIAIPNSIIHARYQLNNFIFKALTTM